MTTVVVAHGALGSAAQMEPFTDALRLTLNINVSVVEFPGHGNTPLTNDAQFRLPHFVDVLGSAVATGVGNAPLFFGYSMGGYVGLALEARAPGTFAGIVTLGTKFDWTPDSAAREAARLDPVAIAQKVPAFANVLAARHEQAGGWELMLRRTGALMRASGDAPLLNDTVLARIAVPVCVAVGTRDDVVSTTESSHAASVMVRGRSTVLSDIPHAIERVPPTLVVELIQDIMREIC